MTRRNVDEGSESLQWPDYLVIAVLLVISASIGIYYRFTGGRQKTTQEYFRGNNAMNVPTLAFTLMVAFFSAIGMLGISGETYIHGAHYVVIGVGYILATPFAAFLYLPVFYKLQNMSVYEYLERRFGVVAKLAASIGNFVQSLLYTGVVLYAPSLALEAATGLSSTMSILLVGLICTFYSTIGGIKAVLATDFFQGALMLASTFVVIGVGSSDMEGGFSEAWNNAVKAQRLDIFDFDIDPTIRHTWFTLVLGGFFTILSTYGIAQMHLQRLVAAKSLRSAQLALFISTPLLIFITCLTSLAGVVLYSWFEGCDPIATGNITSTDQIIAYFAKIRLSKVAGLAGFFVAGIFSGSLSTISAVLNSQAACAIADYIKPICAKTGTDFSDKKAVFYSKLLCFVIGLVCIGIAFLAAGMDNLLQATVAITGMIGGPILGLFSLGIFVEVANEMGSVIGLVLSLAFMSWMSFGGPKPPIPSLPISIEKCLNSSVSDSHELVDFRDTDRQEYFYLYRISYMLYPAIGTLSTMIFGYIASMVVRLLSKNPIPEPDADLFAPILSKRIKLRRNKTKIENVSDPPEIPIFQNSGPTIIYNSKLTPIVSTELKNE